MKHECRRCHKEVECPYCTAIPPMKWACPWINDDEDDMCDSCLKVVAEEMWAAQEEEEEVK